MQQVSDRPAQRARRWLAAAVAVLAPVLVALALRAPAVDWGLPDLLYQDEVYLMEIVARMEDEGSTLPRWRPSGAPEYQPFYEYGHLGLSVIKPAATRAAASARAAGIMEADEPLQPWRVAAGARRTVMLFGLAMIALVVLTGRRLLSLWEGLAAGTVLAVGADHFHYSVWAKPDLVGGALGAAALLAAVMAASRRLAWIAVLAGAAAGLATAAKYNGGVLVGAAVLAALLAGRRWWSRAAWGVAAAAAGFAGFAIGMPHAIGRSGEFWEYVTRRFLHGQQLADFGPPPALGGPLGVFRVLGASIANTFVEANWAGILFVALFVAGLVRLTKRRRPADLVVLAVTLAGLLLPFAWLRRGFHHQLLPVMPAIALVAAAGVGGVWSLVRHASWPRLARGVALGAAGVALFAGAVAGWQHARSLRGTLTDRSYLAQAAWLQQNVPFGTRIGVEAHLAPFPRAAYEVYQAYSLGLNPPSYYRERQYAYLFVNTWIRDFMSFKPEIRAFYQQLPREATLVARVDSHTAFSYGGVMEVWRVHGVPIRAAGATREAIENPGFADGLKGWDVRRLALDLSGDRAGRVSVTPRREARGRTAHVAVSPDGRAHLGQVVAAARGRLRTTLRVDGDVTAYLEMRTFTTTGAHVTTVRHRLRGTCACNEAAPLPHGKWETITVDLPRLDPVGDGRVAELTEFRFVVVCDGCAGGSITVDDVALLAS